MGDWRFWAPRTALAALLIATGDALALWLSPPLREFYPMWGPAQTSATELAKLCAGLTIDMLGWELVFRGLLLRTLLPFGAWAAIAAQMVPFVLLHYDKPPVEMALSLPGGLLAGVFALRSGTFWPTFVLHAVMLVGINAEAILFR